MEQNFIELKFDKLTTNLAGNKLGRNVYQKQAKDLMDFSKKNTFILSDNIEDVAMSFIQGFCYEVVELYGKDKARMLIDIQSNKKDIVNKFRSTILL